MPQKSTKTAAETKADREYYLKIGAYVVGAVIVTGIISDLNPFNWGEPGRVDRLPFDYEATQHAATWVGISEDYPTGYYVYESPWSPNDLANRLHTTMSGTSQPADLDRREAFRRVSNLGLERLKWLHNYWLQKIDGDDTLYRWIDGEWVAGGEDYRAKQQLKKAGVGW